MTTQYFLPEYPASTRAMDNDDSVVSYSDITFMTLGTGGIIMAINGNTRVLEYNWRRNWTRVYADFAMIAREYLVVDSLEWEIAGYTDTKTGDEQLGINIYHNPANETDHRAKWRFYDFMHRRLGGGYLHRAPVTDSIMRTKTQIQIVDETSPFDNTYMRLRNPAEDFDDTMVKIHPYVHADNPHDPSLFRGAIYIDKVAHYVGHGQTFSATTANEGYLSSLGIYEGIPHHMDQHAKISVYADSDHVTGRSRELRGRELMWKYMDGLLGMEYSATLDDEDLSERAIWRHREFHTSA